MATSDSMMPRTVSALASVARTRSPSITENDFPSPVPVFSNGNNSSSVTSSWCSTFRKLKLFCGYGQRVVVENLVVVLRKFSMLLRVRLNQLEQLVLGAVRLIKI